MSTKILFFLLLMLSLAGCKVGNVAYSGGVDNQSYLQFLQGGNIPYKNGVEVYVDNNPVFTAQVDKIEKKTVRGNVYVIKEGTHDVKVLHEGKVLYEKKILVGNQETKQITLP